MMMQSLFQVPSVSSLVPSLTSLVPSVSSLVPSPSSSPPPPPPYIYLYAHYHDLLVHFITIFQKRIHVYVMREAWICAIPGLSCANPGSMVCTTNHGLTAQSSDCACANHGSGQSWDCSCAKYRYVHVHV